MQHTKFHHKEIQFYCLPPVQVLTFSMILKIEEDNLNQLLENYNEQDF